MITGMNREPVVCILMAMLFTQATAFPSKVGCGLIGESGMDVMKRQMIMGEPPRESGNLVSIKSYHNDEHQNTVYTLSLNNLQSGGIVLHTSHGTLNGVPSQLTMKTCDGPESLYYQQSGVASHFEITLTVPDAVHGTKVSVITAEGYGAVSRQELHLKDQDDPAASGPGEYGTGPESSKHNTSTGPGEYGSGPESSEPKNTASFNPHERQFSLEWRVKNYTLPKIETNYVDFVFNFNDVSHDMFHIVYGEALVDVEWGLHHFVVTGCSQKIEASKEGLPLTSTPAYCNLQIGGFAGWAPGATLWDMPLSAGVPIGAGAGIVAVSINVH